MELCILFSEHDAFVKSIELNGNGMKFVFCDGPFSVGIAIGFVWRVHCLVGKLSNTSYEVCSILSDRIECATFSDSYCQSFEV